MDRSDLAFAGAARQAELVRAGEVSSRELVEMYLERIERLQPRLNCYSNVMAERALADAGQADARRGAGGAAERPLLGVPIAVKDVMDVAGEVTTWGTVAHDGQPARDDCDLVRVLRSAGAVILGKTTTPELAIIGDTEGPAFGITRNPWDTRRSAGGSSGGSGCAVAAGLCAAATASDGAGSIRIPAANNGLFGLKPQRDRVGLRPPAEHWHGLSVYGFETRDVRDTALLFDLAAERPEGVGSYSQAAASPPGSLRIAVSARSPWPFIVRGSVRQVLDRTAALLRRLGHTVVPANPPFGTISNAISVLYLRGIADDVRAMPHPERLQKRTRGFGRMGGLIGDGVLRWAKQEGGRFAERAEDWFGDYDALLTPVATRPPVLAGNWQRRPAPLTLLGSTSTYPFNVAWNVTGQPSAAIPAGTSADGLPIGLQLVGRRDGEGTLLSLSAQLEAELRWPERRPQL